MLRGINCKGNNAIMGYCINIVLNRKACGGIADIDVLRDHIMRAVFFEYQLVRFALDILRDIVACCNIGIRV